MKIGISSMMNILAICGSLRKNSSNFNLLEITRSFFPENTSWDYFNISELPFFDPQLQFDSAIPETVKTIRHLASQADYIVISTPEYAHGIPGVLKNALEWLICEETLQKKVVILIGSPSGGEFVKAYLTETIRTMDMVPSDQRTLVVTTARGGIDEELEKTVKSFVEGILG